MTARKVKNVRKNIFEHIFVFLKLNWLKLLISLLVLIVSFMIQQNQNVIELQEIPQKNNEFIEKEDDKPKYWNVCTATWNPNGNLRTMNRVFERLGYTFVNPLDGDDWDVLWSLE
jgi:hypothetical protein